MQETPPTQPTSVLDSRYTGMPQKDMQSDFFFFLSALEPCERQLQQFRLASLPRHSLINLPKTPTTLLPSQIDMIQFCPIEEHRKSCPRRSDLFVAEIRHLMISEPSHNSPLSALLCFSLFLSSTVLALATSTCVSEKQSWKKRTITPAYLKQVILEC